MLVDEMDTREWILVDETATQMFSRAHRERPALLFPPLNRFPLRTGNVLEIAGPSSSAKSQILMQAAINCILPAHYGGLERAVFFFDLDCRFDILRFEQLLKFRFKDTNGAGDELIHMCLKRFLYVRCYDSFEFLATLKTLQDKLHKVRKELGVSVHLLMIDSIGAYYWVDRASTSLPLSSRNRKMISLQSVMEAIIHEVKSLLLLQPMIVLATKASLFGEKSAANDARSRTSKKFSSHDATGQSAGEGGKNFSHREYMPSVWQSFITHRIFVHSSNLEIPADGHAKEQTFIREWLLPSLGFTDKFVVRDAGIFII